MSRIQYFSSINQLLRHFVQVYYVYQCVSLTKFNSVSRWILSSQYYQMPFRLNKNQVISSFFCLVC